MDRARLASDLAQRLRAAGADVGLTSIESLARALSAGPPRTMTDLYWTARITLVRRAADLATFDRVFAGAVDELASVADETELAGAAIPVPRASEDGIGPGELPWLTRTEAIAVSGGDVGPDDGKSRPQRTASALLALGDVPFPDLDPDELAQLATWLDDAVHRWPTRRSRRTVRDSAGRRISLRRTVSAARRTAWEPVRLVRTTTLRRPRRLVMLCDVSQSMQPYAAAYLHLMRAAAVLTRAEVFAFSTSLTRLTGTLAHRSTDVAIAEAGERVRDRFGGTRIAATIAALLRSHHGSAVRGAIVIIASDGWDSDPPEELARSMARLRRRAHRVIWLNPRVAAPDYEPLVGGMAAAWPYCDEVLPADNFRALLLVVDALAGRPDVSSRGSRTPMAGNARC